MWVWVCVQIKDKVVILWTYGNPNESFSFDKCRLCSQNYKYLWCKICRSSCFSICHSCLYAVEIGFALVICNESTITIIIQYTVYSVYTHRSVWKHLPTKWTHCILKYILKFQRTLFGENMSNFLKFSFTFFFSFHFRIICE